MAQINPYVMEDIFCSNRNPFLLPSNTHVGFSSIYPGVNWRRPSLLLSQNWNETRIHNDNYQTMSRTINNNYYLLQYTLKYKKTKMYKPRISPAPTNIPQRPVSRFADGNVSMCPTDVMKTALQKDNSKPFMNITIHWQKWTNLTASAFNTALSQC